MRRAIFSAVVLCFVAEFCAYKVDDRPWLLWTVTVADTTGAMTEATITLGPQPWETTLAGTREFEAYYKAIWLGERGFDVHWNGLDCQLADLYVWVEAPDQVLGGIEFASRALDNWLGLLTFMLVFSSIALLPELLKMMRGDALPALTALILCVLICGGFIALPSLTGSAVSNDYMGFMSEVPGCTGSVTLLAQFVGVRWEGVAWLLASVVCGGGAVAAGRQQVWAMLSRPWRRAQEPKDGQEPMV